MGEEIKETRVEETRSFATDAEGGAAGAEEGDIGGPSDVKHVASSEAGDAEGGAVESPDEAED